MIQKLLVIFFPLLLIIGSCTEDPIINCDYPIPVPCDTTISFLPPLDTCMNLPPEPATGYSYKGPDVQFNFPIWNPSNANEFIFNRIENTDISPVSVFWKLNICTGKRTTVVDDIISASFDWNKQDWIVFLAGSYNVWKVKSSGDSLTQLTSGIRYREAFWHHDEQAIICSANDPNHPLLFSHSLMLDVNGAIIDTLPFRIGRGAARGNLIADLMLVDDIPKLGYINLDTEDFISLLDHPIQDFGAMQDIDWLDDDHIIWTNDRGVNKVNIHTQEVELIKKNCESLLTPRLSVSPNGNGELLLEYWRRSVPEPIVLFSDIDILLLNINTGEEQIINLQ